MIRMSPSAAAITSAIALAVLASVQPATAQGGPGLNQPGFQPGAPPQMTEQQPGALEQFRQVLQQYGQFVQHPRYGEVWTPNPGVTPPGWRPYPPCHWVYDRQQQAWFYNDQTPWGQIVHHHGRWANDPSIGWMWIADANFGPGWVVWRADRQTVSWAAMLPEQDGQQEPPPEHWHTQDARTFNAGCRQSGPAPVAAIPPAPRMVAPAIPVAAPGPVVVRPGIIVPPPVVIPPRPCHRIFPRPWWCRPVVIDPPRRPCHFIFPRPPWCRPIVHPPRPCHLRPWLPHCRGIGRPHRPFPPIARPGHRPGPIVCVRHPCRPGVHRPFPHRPNVARPFPRRPDITRPFPGRPSITRPFPGRPSMGGLGPRGPQIGGGFRPGGGGLRIGRR